MYFSQCLKEADKQIGEISWPLPRQATGRTRTKEILLFSYADDLNPLVVTKGTMKEHQHTVQRVIQVLDGAAQEQQLRWDPAKDTDITFGSSKTPPITSLGIKITHNLDFAPHIADRCNKAKAALSILTRLSKRIGGGLNPKSLRSIYTGRIRPIGTWGAQLWNGNNNLPSHARLIEPLARLEYQALKRITGGYNGSSQQKLGFIANVEPIQAFVDHLSITWAARSMASGDPIIQQAISLDDWSQGHNPHNEHRSIISEACHKCMILPEEISYGDRDSHYTLPNVHSITIFQPEDQSSKSKASWDIQLAALVKDGFFPI